MNDRFNSSGSFVVSISRPSTSSAPTALSDNIATPTDLSDPYSKDSNNKKISFKNDANKDLRKTHIDKEFEGNRFGVSPLAFGLILGLGLIVFGIAQCKKEDFPHFGSSRGEIREYKRYIRPVDLPGR